MAVKGRDHLTQKVARTQRQLDRLTAAAAKIQALIDDPATDDRADAVLQVELDEISQSIQDQSDKMERLLLKVPPPPGTTPTPPPESQLTDPLTGQPMGPGPTSTAAPSTHPSGTSVHSGPGKKPEESKK